MSSLNNLMENRIQPNANWALSGDEASFLRALIQQNPLATVVLDENQRIQMCNPAFEKMFLLRFSEIRGLNVDELVTSEGAMRNEAHSLSQDILAGRTISQSTKRCRGNGTLIDVEVHCIPLLAKSKVIGAYALYQDITERTRSIQALRESEERYRRLFEKNLAGVFRSTISQGRILDCNDAFARILGYGSRERILRQKAWTLHFSKSDRRQVTDLLVEKRTLANHEIRLRRKDGRPVSVLENATVFPDDKGNLDIVEGTIVDITTQKQAQRSLRSLSDRLLQVQDEERRRMGRELHDMIGQSLAVVTMYLSVLKESETRLGNAAQSALSEATALAEQCSREIRTFAYLLHPPLIDEVGLISALRWYATGFSKRSGIAVQLELPELLGRLPIAAETALFRIVQESLTNVLRHSGSSVAKVRLVRDTRCVTLEIEDRGKGIMRRLLNHRDGDIASLGVGITGMRERMIQLGGKLEIDSRKTGTVVRAILPIGRKEDTLEDPHIGRRRPLHRSPGTKSSSRSTSQLASVR